MHVQYSPSTAVFFLVLSLPPTDEVIESSDSAFDGTLWHAFCLPLQLFFRNRGHTVQDEELLHKSKILREESAKLLHDLNELIVGSRDLRRSATAILRVTEKLTSEEDSTVLELVTGSAPGSVSV